MVSTNSPIGYVVQANAAIDMNAFEAHERIIQSESLTILNNSGYGKYLHDNVIPNTHIYCRNYDLGSGDEDDWKQYGVSEYFDKYGGQAVEGVGLQVWNEPGFNKPIVDKALAMAQEAVKRKIPISLFGPSVGTTPASADDWAQYDDFVHYICLHRDLIALDVHEYWTALPTSGMVTAQTKPGEALYFVDHLKYPRDWPISLNQLTNFYHVGRIKHLFEYVQRKGYPIPTVDLGEFGADAVSDTAQLDAFLKSLPSSVPGRSARGYKTYGEFWKSVFPPGISLQGAYGQCLAWLWETILRPIGVRSFRLYTWGNSGAGTPNDWSDFDIATDRAMQGWLEGYAKTLSVPSAPVPAPIPTPAPPEPILDLGKIVAKLESAKALIQDALTEVHKVQGDVK